MEYIQCLLGGVFIGSISSYYYANIQKEQQLKQQRKELETIYKRKIEELREKIDSNPFKL